MTTTRTADAVIRNTRAALIVLDHAERVGLPLPMSVMTEGVDCIPTTFVFTNLEDLAEWSRWTEKPIASREHPSGTVTYDLTSVELDHEIRCMFVKVPSAAEVTW